MDLQPNQLKRHIAPIIRSLLMSDWPTFDIRSRRGLPPDKCCRGTRPSQAAKSRPPVNVSNCGANASMARALKEPTPGIV